MTILNKSENKNSLRLSLAIINAKIWTGTVTGTGTDTDTKECSHSTINALGVHGETIVIISDSQTVLNNCDSTTIVFDAKQALLVPGLTDCHCHFLDGGLRLLSVQLRDVKSEQQFQERISEVAATLAPGTWILGGDWDHYNWGGSLPNKSWIDSVTPHHPVWLNRMDGHMSLANSYALKHAGVSRETKDVEGGEIVRDSQGELTGVLKDNAQNLITSKLPPRSWDFKKKALEAAMTYVASFGVTEVHTMVTVDCACGLWPKDFGAKAEYEDMEAAFDELEVYRSAHREGRLRTRIRAALPLASWRRLHDENKRDNENKNNKDKSSYGDDWLKTGCLKAMLDGSLGSHTAAMLEDYDDTPGYRGHLIWDPVILERHVREASEAGFQVMVHAIGDKAVREQLSIFERVAKGLPGRDLRFRLEHAQHISPQDIHRFGELGVVASLQMSHLADDGRWATKSIGPLRMRTSWPMKSLLQAKAKVALGSDWFVTKPAPLEGIHAAVTRQTIDGQFPAGLVAEECVTVEDALRGYTVEAAYAAFEENRRGTLEVGKLADLVLFDRDLLSIPTDDILQAQVLLTVVGGKVVFSKL